MPAQKTKLDPNQTTILKCKCNIVLQKQGTKFDPNFDKGNKVKSILPDTQKQERKLAYKTAG